MIHEYVDNYVATEYRVQRVFHERSQVLFQAEPRPRVDHITDQGWQITQIVTRLQGECWCYSVKVFLRCIDDEVMVYI